jgi:hypothetical protein
VHEGLKEMKRILLAIVGLLAVAVLTAACSSPGTNSGTVQEQKSSNQSENAAERTLPAPVFSYSEGRWVLIEAEASIALGVQTTTFFFQQGDPNPYFSCPSIGYPVANTAQLTNPQKVIPDTNPGHPNSTSLTVGNMDPLQYYPPTSSQGTYVLCVDRQGKPYLNYSEPNVHTILGSAVWVPASGNTVGHIQVTGTAAMPVCRVTQGSNGKNVTKCTKD